MNQHTNNDSANEKASLIIHAALGIATVKLAEGAKEEAEKLCWGILYERKEKRFPSGLQDCETKTVLARILEDDKMRLPEATKNAEAAVNGFLWYNGESSLAYLDAVRRLSSIYEKAKKWDAAEKRLKEAVEGYGRALGLHHSETLGASLRLGRLHLQQKRPHEAESACRRAHVGFDETHGPNARETLDAGQALEEALEKALEEIRRHGGFGFAGRGGRV